MFGKKVSRRSLLRSMIVAGSGVVLAACAPAAQPEQPQPTSAEGESEAPPEAPTEAKEEVPTAAPPPEDAQTIVIWMWSEQNRGHFKEQADRWNDTYPDKPALTVDYQIVPSPEEAVQKGMNAMAAGSGIPDVFPIGFENVSKFFKGTPPLAEDHLMDFVPKLDVYDPQWRDNYIGFAPYTWQGKTYGFEIGISPTGYYYREDIFEKVGVQMPIETWDDFMLAGEKLAQAGHFMLDFDSAGNDLLTLLSHQAGAVILNNDGQVAFDEERVYRSLDLIVQGAKNKYFLPTESYWGPPHFAGLNDGSIAGVVSANWYSEFILKANCQDTAGKWRVQATPKWKKTAPWGGETFNERPTSSLGGSCMSIPKKGPKPDLTFDYMAFAMLSPEGGISVYKHIQQVPMNKSVIKDESIINVPDEFYGGQPYNKVFADIAEFIPPITIGAYYNEALQELSNIMVPAVSGEGTPEDLIHTAAEKARDLIAIGG